MKIGVIQLHFHLFACTSLKEKRGRIKPLIARLHRQFNVSAVELGLQDKWQEELIACAMISNDVVIIQNTFEKIKEFSQSFFTEITLTEENIEIF